MNVFTFKDQFEASILAGTKLHTIRAPRGDGRPRAKVGERISLRVWTGRPYASRQREFGQATVDRVEGFTMQDTGHELLVRLGGRMVPLEELNPLASADGFGSMIEMADWFSREHGLPFAGLMVRWKDLQPTRQ